MMKSLTCSRTLHSCQGKTICFSGCIKTLYLFDIFVYIYIYIYTKGIFSVTVIIAVVVYGTHVCISQVLLVVISLL